MADEAYQVSPAAVRGNLVNAALQDIATLPHKLGLNLWLPKAELGVLPNR
jgi:hypothetical protein